MRIILDHTSQYLSLIHIFTLVEVPEGEVSFASVNGTAYPKDKTVIFDVANATAGTMKRRGRKKAE